jgi:hypothetical protein
MVDPVHRKKTRLLAELYLATLRMRADKFFPGLRVTDAGPLLFTGATLLVLTMKGKTATLAAISRFCGIPHTSAARHLQVMSRLGWVRREGRYFIFKLERLDAPEFQDYVRDVTAMLSSAVRKLTETVE